VLADRVRQTVLLMQHSLPTGSSLLGDETRVSERGNVPQQLHTVTRACDQEKASSGFPFFVALF